MTKKILIISIVVFLFYNNGYSQHEKALKALILTGQCMRYHNWEVSSRLLKEHLINTRIFNIDVTVTPSKGIDMSGFCPNFKDYDVVIVDYEGDNWTEETTNNFIEYVRGGGGVVFVHTAFAAINGSKEFDEIVGLRSYDFDKSKVHVHWKDGKMTKDKNSLKAGIHPPRHDFMITIRDKGHPITNGLPEKWLHASDDLYSQLCGPAKNITILSTAYSDPDRGYGTTGKHEPMLFTVGYGEGRVFVCVMGHVGYKSSQGGLTKDAMLCSGFITIFQRGAEWAATGKVTQAVPDDFPTETKISIRKSKIGE